MKWLKLVLILLLAASLSWYGYEVHTLLNRIAYVTSVQAHIADRSVIDFCMHMPETQARTYVSCAPLFNRTQRSLYPE